jgi:hypothetical protein
MADIKVMRDPSRRDTVISTRVSDTDSMAMGPNVHAIALTEIAKAIAAEFLRTHMQEILAAIDPQAVANLAVADAAVGIRKAVDDGAAGITRELRREREVLMPGFFGVKRGVVR